MQLLSQCRSGTDAGPEQLKKEAISINCAPLALFY
jgi:hypothetical protein